MWSYARSVTLVTSRSKDAKNQVNLVIYFKLTLSDSDPTVKSLAPTESLPQIIDGIT